MWKAIYHNGSVLPQIEGEQEHLIKEIDYGQLSIFKLELGDASYAVNLKDGTFNIRGVTVKFEEQGNFDLIYFKRVRHTLGGASGPKVTHHIGWQMKGDQDKPNLKRLMAVEEGNEIITFKEHIVFSSMNTS